MVRRMLPLCLITANCLSTTPSRLIFSKKLWVSSVRRSADLQQERGGQMALPEADKLKGYMHVCSDMSFPEAARLKARKTIIEMLKLWIWHVRAHNHFKHSRYMLIEYEIKSYNRIPNTKAKKLLILTYVYAALRRRLLGRRTWLHSPMGVVSSRLRELPFLADLFLRELPFQMALPEADKLKGYIYICYMHVSSDIR